MSADMHCSALLGFVCQKMKLKLLSSIMFFHKYLFIFIYAEPCFNDTVIRTRRTSTGVIQPLLLNISNLSNRVRLKAVRNTSTECLRSYSQHNFTATTKSRDIDCATREYQISNVVDLQDYMGKG